MAIPGISELLIIAAVGLISIAIPVATLVGIVLVHAKVKRIEALLSQRD